MATPVIMPKLEMAQKTAIVIEWLKQEGEHVEKEEPLLTVETDKVTVDIEAPASGILAGVRVVPQQVVPVTEVIAYILEPEEGLPQEPSERAKGSLPPSIQAPPAALAQPTTTTVATPVAQRLAKAHRVDLSTVVGTGPAGRITRMDVEAAWADHPRPTVETGPEKVRATPAARRIAREHGIDLSAVRGSGPRGRVQADDVRAFTPVPAAAPAPAPEVVPLQGMRRTIAERMTSSYRTAPHITFTVRVDMTSFTEVRAQLNAKAEASGGPHVSATAFIVKAVAWALKRHPWLNSTLRDEHIHLLPDVNVGVAVAVEDGLIVPVVCQVGCKSVEEVAAEVNDLTARARVGQLAPADIAGGTFTVSNLGPFGIEQFTAIINPPQAAILAVGATQPEVVVGEGDRIVVRRMMRMTLSVDHRIVDGAVAAHFLVDLRAALEAPALLLW